MLLTTPRPDKAMDNFSSVYHLDKASDKTFKAMTAQWNALKKLKKFHVTDSAKRILGIAEFNELEYIHNQIRNLVWDIKQADAADKQDYASKEHVHALIVLAESNVERTMTMIDKIKSVGFDNAYTL